MRAEVAHGKGRHSYKCNCVCKHFDSISPQPSSRIESNLGRLLHLIVAAYILVWVWVAHFGLV